MQSDEFVEISFLADKVHAHHWPLDTQKWDDLTRQRIDKDLNTNNKQILVKSTTIVINNYEFKSIKKVGLTIPLFQKQCTLIFEGNFEEFYAHVHITTKEKDYLEIFNKLIHWRSKYFPDSVS